MGLAPFAPRSIRRAPVRLGGEEAAGAFQLGILADPPAGENSSPDGEYGVLLQRTSTCIATRRSADNPPASSNPSFGCVNVVLFTTGDSMKIQEKHQFHGAALTQIVEHESFKALNRASNKYGHYRVNADRHTFVKYRKAPHSPWSFTFQPDELKAIQAQLKNKVFLCLVCGTSTVCALTVKEFTELIDLKSSSAQWVRVEVSPGCSCHVFGSSGKLQRAVSHNSFPGIVFA